MEYVDMEGVWSNAQATVLFGPQGNTLDYVRQRRSSFGHYTRLLMSVSLAGRWYSSLTGGSNRSAYAIGAKCKPLDFGAGMQEMDSRAFKLLQQAQQENATSNAAVIFFGCTSVLPKKSLLHDVLRKELRLLPVDVMILTTHAMVSEDSERLVVPPTALRASEGGYPPSLLDVAQHAAEAEYMNQPTAIAFTLTASVLAYEVPERTRVGAACEMGPIQASMKEMCTVREEIPDFVHGWVIFNVDMADYDGSCNGASRTLERVRAIRETFDEYRKLDVGQPPDEAC
ncbi:hypothetical protein V5799_004061 [Amblyomma americanum]|uniref:Uncharacterized protein n=1 Tax=Amblyomma americanum TaxID=6943 RepID=A0AAQ4D766_AMBAM